MKRVGIQLLVLIFALTQLKAQECKAHRAEWQNSCQIMMFTPEEELFDGLAHRAAGVFGEYFDVSAAAGHMDLTRMPDDSSITVQQPRDVLLQMDIDTLRGMASSVLGYDISGLTKKTTLHFGQSEDIYVTRKNIFRIVLRYGMFFVPLRRGLAK